MRIQVAQHLIYKVKAGKEQLGIPSYEIFQISTKSKDIYEAIFLSVDNRWHHADE